MTSAPVDEGTYTYHRGGQALPFRDTFAIVGGVVTSRRTNDNGPTMTVVAEVDEIGLTRHFELRWEHPGPGQIAQRDAEYSLHERRLTVTIDGHTTEREVPANTVLFPLLRVFQGAVIVAVAEAGSHGRTVVIPDLHALTDPDRLLHPTVETRTAAHELTEDDHRHVYRYEGSVYDASSRFVIDPVARRLVSYRFPQPDGTAIEVALQGG